MILTTPLQLFGYFLTHYGVLCKKAKEAGYETKYETKFDYSARMRDFA